MFLRGGLISLVAMAASLFAGSAIPNTSSTYIGDAKNVKVTSRNGNDPFGGGGSFNGKLSGWDTTFWCVDSQLYFNYSNTNFLANVYTLDQIAANSSKVRYGSVTNSGSTKWTNTGTVSGNGGNDFANFANFNTATQRYRAAAWLITQYNFATANQPQSGIRNNGDPVNPGSIYAAPVTNTKRNADVQKTIWSLMHNTTPGADTTGIDDGVKVWLNAAYANYTSVDMTKWAVVSWTVNASGVLQDDDRQTFLVQVVPEPGFYGVLAAGFAGLAFAARRRKQSC